MSITTVLDKFFGAKSHYYKEFLFELDKKGIDYVILNLNECSLEVNSNTKDLDIVIPSKHAELVSEILRNLDFFIYTKPNTKQFLWIRYVNDNILKIHIHIDLHYFDRKIVFFKDIEKKNHFVEFNEEYILFCIQNFYKNKYEEKVKKRLECFNKKIEKGKVNTLLSSKYKEYKKILDVFLKEINENSKPWKYFHLILLLRVFPVTTTMFLFKKLLVKFKKLLSFGNNDLVIVFLGVDGAGKTTTINYLINDLDVNLICKYRYFGLKKSIINNIRSFLSSLFKRKQSLKESNRYEKLLNSFQVKNISIFKRVYNFIIGILYWIEYNLRYLSLVKLNSIPATTLYLIDRGFYDVLLYYKNPIVNFLFMKMSFKPDMIVYLTGNTDELFERKREMSKEKIKLTKVKYDFLVKELAKHGFNLKTIDSTKFTIIEVKKGIEKCMFELLLKKNTAE